MLKNKANKSLKITVAVTYLIMVLVNALANILPINGNTSGQVSDFYANLFAPAGITFTIWGVIYLLLGSYILYQFGFFQGNVDYSKEELFKKIGIYFFISSILNGIWIFSWHYHIIELSLVLIIMMLVCLILINQQTKKHRFSLKDKIFIRLPFSIYFGWLTVATIANVTTLLVKLGWNGFGFSEVIWTIVVIIVGLIIGSLTLIRNKDMFYGFAIIWAYVGIYMKHTSVSGFNGKYQSIIATVIVSIVLLIISEIYLVIKGRKRDILNR